jgi:hypothetical protein
MHGGPLRGGRRVGTGNGHDCVMSPLLSFWVLTMLLFGVVQHATKKWKTGGGGHRWDRSNMDEWITQIGT